MPCDSPFYVLPKAGTEKVPVPCGRCPPCKINRVNGWVFRLSEQQKVSDSAHFVTLTYDTRHVPISKNGFMTLCKKDFQDYMKRLRKLCPHLKVSYYAVGEYGTNNKRPHYHAIVFNVPDVEMYHKAWGLGQIQVGTVTSDSMAYCMKYIDKSNYKPEHSRDDRVREFPLMSKKLGLSYVNDDTVSYHQADLSRLYITRPGGHKIAMPRYIKQKIYSEKQIKQQSKIAQSITDQKLEAEKREYVVLDYPDTFTFEAYQDMKKHGRYQRFYSNQKNRDI